MEKLVGANKPFIMQRADPYVFKHSDGWYYFTASVPAYDGIVLRRAKSIDKLSSAQEVYIWRKHETGKMSFHVWAPEIHFIRGKWYIYFAAGEAEDVWAIRPYVLECTGSNPLADEWIELGPLQPADEDLFSFKGFSLDATIFELKDHIYCVWAEKVGVGKQISNLYIARMASPIQLETVQVLLSTPDYDWERVGFWVNEGAAVLRHQGKVFLTYSASETGACYCMGMLTIDENDDLLDPGCWHKERYPVLQTDEGLGIYGPGHNSFTVDEEGEIVMVYHARNEEKSEGNPLYNPNRHAMLMKLKWDEGGHPIFSFE